VALPTPSARVITGHVRAAHLRVLSRLLQHHVGESGVARIVNQLPALARALDRLPEEPSVVTRPPPDPIQAAEALLGPTEGIDYPSVHRSVPGPPSARVITGHVRAAHLRVLSRLLQHHLGESGLARIVSQLPALAGALSPSLPPLAWVDLAALIAGFEVARSHVPSQLVPRKVGRGTMSATFARLFGADPTTLSAETVLTALPAFWARYHDWGEVEASVHPGSADVVVHGYPGSTDVCALVAAELERVVELTGAPRALVTHAACAFTGAPRCAYRVRWDVQPGTFAGGGPPAP
ncbi:MAG TPA: hypothetical protein VF469_24910, partial [Kofleriaceae bacterium]